MRRHSWATSWRCFTKQSFRCVKNAQQSLKGREQDARGQPHHYSPAMAPLVAFQLLMLQLNWSRQSFIMRSEEKLLIFFLVPSVIVGLNISEHLKEQFLTLRSKWFIKVLIFFLQLVSPKCPINYLNQASLCSYLFNCRFITNTWVGKWCKWWISGSPKKGTGKYTLCRCLFNWLQGSNTVQHWLLCDFIGTIKACGHILHRGV